VHKDYVYGIMTRAGISVVRNAVDQLFILHKKRGVPLMVSSIASIAPSIPVFGAVPSSLTRTRAPPQAWSDLEISQFKEGVIAHGWSRWSTIVKDFVITRTSGQVGDCTIRWKAKYPEEYEHLMSASSESDDEKPESKSPEVGGSAKCIRYE
jgi:hypothetical protein